MADFFIQEEFWQFLPHSKQMIYIDTHKVADRDKRKAAPKEGRFIR